LSCDGVGAVGSCIANCLAERIQVEMGFSVAVVDKGGQEEHPTKKTLYKNSI
jgi:hypothetical protein